MAGVEQYKKTSHLSRSDFIKLGAVATAAGLLGLFAGYDRVHDPLQEQNETWKKVLGDQDNFVEEYKDKLSRMHIAANICPDYRLFAEGIDADAAISMLVEKFGCREIRLGIWWDTYAEQGITPYLSWFEACKKNNVKVMTSLPSPKGPRAPEQQEPKDLRDRLRETHEFPLPESIITPDSKFGQEALKAAQSFFEDMKRNNLNPHYYDYCPVNEPCDANGNWKFRMSEEFMYEYCKLISEYSPHSTVLFNTSGVSVSRPSPLEQCVDYAINIQSKLPSLKYKIGYDVYHQTRIGKINKNMFVDTITGAKLLFGKNHIKKQEERMRKHEIKKEVTEAQEEGWERAYDSGPPRYMPESEEHLRYILARIADEFVENNSRDPFIVRLWGVENDLIEMLKDDEYVNSNSSFTLIKRINEMSRQYLN